jgi:hypothetical protein
VRGGGGAERLRVERTGGFGGLTLRASVGLDELSPEEDAALEECFRLPASGPPGPDRFVYRFRVGGRDVTVQEDRVPPALQPLLSRLAENWS